MRTVNLQMKRGARVSLLEGSMDIMEIRADIPAALSEDGL